MWPTLKVNSLLIFFLWISTLFTFGLASPLKDRDYYDDIPEDYFESINLSPNDFYVMKRYLPSGLHRQVTRANGLNLQKLSTPQQRKILRDIVSGRYFRTLR